MTTSRSIISVAVLSVALIACGGGGGSAGTTGSGAAPIGSGSPSTPTTPIATPKNSLFAYDAGHAVLAGLPSLALSAGANIVNAFGTTGAPTGGLAFDSAHDLLFATTADGIAVYEHATQLQNTIAPVRTLRVDPTVASSITALFYDKQHDVLYASGARSGSTGVLLAFNGPSNLSGTALPNRTVVGIPQGPFTIDTTRNILYSRQANVATRMVYQFKNIDALNGTVAAETLTALSFNDGGTVLNVAVDATHDRLYYVADTEGVRFVDNASTSAGLLTGAPITYLPTTLLALTLTHNIGAALAYDPSGDRLYAGSGTTAYQFDNASRIPAGNGSANALAASLPAGTQVSAIALP